MTERYWPLRRFSDRRDNIWVARDLETDEEVVLKLTDIETDPSYATKNDQTNLEAHALRDLSELNPFRIVNYKSFYRNSESQFVLAMEKAQCSLADALYVRPRLTESEAKEVIRCVLEALVTCHSKYIVHRDVKPENLFLFSDHLDSLKLGDFGICAEDNGYSSCGGMKGTKGYMAPEVLSKKQYGRAVDIWATGATTYQLLYGTVPYPANTPKVGMFSAKPKLQFPVTFNISKEGIEFIQLLLSDDPDDRPSASKALQHPWFNAATPAIRDEVAAKVVGTNPYGVAPIMTPNAATTRTSQQAPIAAAAAAGAPVAALSVSPAPAAEAKPTPETLHGFKDWIRLIPVAGPAYFVHLPSRKTQWEHPVETGVAPDEVASVANASAGVVEKSEISDKPDTSEKPQTSQKSEKSEKSNASILSASFIPATHEDDEDEVPLIRRGKQSSQLGVHDEGAAAKQHAHVHFSEEQLVIPPSAAGYDSISDNGVSPEPTAADMNPSGPGNEQVLDGSETVSTDFKSEQLTVENAAENEVGKLVVSPEVLDRVVSPEVLDRLDDVHMPPPKVDNIMTFDFERNDSLSRDGDVVVPHEVVGEGVVVGAFEDFHLDDLPGRFDSLRAELTISRLPDGMVATRDEPAETGEGFVESDVGPELEEWRMVAVPANTTYYYNVRTKTSQWQHPRSTAAPTNLPPSPPVPPYASDSDPIAMDLVMSPTIEGAPPLPPPKELSKNSTKQRSVSVKKTNSSIPATSGFQPRVSSAPAALAARNNKSSAAPVKTGSISQGGGAAALPTTRKSTLTSNPTKVPSPPPRGSPTRVLSNAGTAGVNGKRTSSPLPASSGRTPVASGRSSTTTNSSPLSPTQTSPNSSRAKTKMEAAQVGLKIVMDKAGTVAKSIIPKS
ncbi:hypothetical protein HDU81_003165 [Chytriomyces hyalinus]|nr:hypothetical protein HDU81_003165 [Chytriomyces hyalinus]